VEFFGSPFHWTLTATIIFSVEISPSGKFFSNSVEVFERVGDKSPPPLNREAFAKYQRTIPASPSNPPIQDVQLRITRGGLPLFVLPF